MRRCSDEGPTCAICEREYELREVDWEDYDPDADLCADCVAHGCRRDGEAVHPECECCGVPAPGHVTCLCDEWICSGCEPEEEAA